ncbi:hypothetical protein I204_07426 [Kwoniella mangroviensis CBS 8886]|nr:hypothetical protein I204_07426 [Kwoniella mangroviensis CBS 8886]
MPVSIFLSDPSNWTTPHTNSQGELVSISQHKERTDDSQSEEIIKRGIEALGILSRRPDDFHNDFEEIGLGKIAFILEEEIFQLTTTTEKEGESEVIRVLKWDKKWVYHSSAPPCDNPHCAGYTSDRLPRQESWGRFIQEQNYDNQSCNTECDLSKKMEQDRYIPKEPHIRWTCGIYSYRDDLGTIRCCSRDISDPGSTQNMPSSSLEGRKRLLKSECFVNWLNGL